MVRHKRAKNDYSLLRPSKLTMMDSCMPCQNPKISKVLEVKTFSWVSVICFAGLRRDGPAVSWAAARAPVCSLALLVRECELSALPSLVELFFVVGIDSRIGKRIILVFWLVEQLRNFIGINFTLHSQSSSSQI